MISAFIRLWQIRCRKRGVRLTGSGRLRPPTRAHSWSQSRGGCRGAAPAGMLQTPRQHGVMNVWGVRRVVREESRGERRRAPALRLTDGFRKGMFKQSDAGCLGEEKNSRGPRARPGSPPTQLHPHTIFVSVSLSVCLGYWNHTQPWAAVQMQLLFEFSININNDTLMNIHIVLFCYLIMANILTLHHYPHSTCHMTTYEFFFCLPLIPLCHHGE